MTPEKPYRDEKENYGSNFETFAKPQNNTNITTRNERETHEDRIFDPPARVARISLVKDIADLRKR